METTEVQPSHPYGCSELFLNAIDTAAIGNAKSHADVPKYPPLLFTPLIFWGQSQIWLLLIP